MGNCFPTQANTVSPVSSVSNPDTSNNHNRSLYKDSRSSQKDLSLGSLHAFSYSDLRSATRKFSNDGKLGEGGFGGVYKGYLDEQTLMPGPGMLVAIKKLNLEGLQGHREWETEVNFLAALDHPNVVKLIGFCCEDSHRLLVYEYMSRGSLENHLFHQGSHNRCLSWEIRMKIAVDAARGLAFLHYAPRCVIYRDFKASNILLDEHYNAKLSDFGLAKDGPTGDDTHVSTRVLGTYGYAAPEYLATGHLTARSDVYSFGVVLLELLSGRRAMDLDRPYGEQKVVEWATPFLANRRQVPRIIDPRLDGKYSLKGTYKAANIALQCLKEDAKARPSMKEVVESLESLLHSKNVAHKYVQQS